MVEYITPWAREPIKYGYQKWFDSLKPGDQICLQKFQTPRDCLGYPFETWSFEIGYLANWCERLQFQPKYGSDSTYLASDGSAIYHSGQEWGEVFPARVVPYHSDLNIIGEYQYRSIGHLPIYEPLYLSMVRSVVAVPFGKNYSRRLHDVASDRRCYTVETGGCTLVHIFADDALEGLPGFLYSQYVKD